MRLTTLTASAYSYRNDRPDRQTATVQSCGRKTVTLLADESPSLQSVTVVCKAMTVKLKMMS